MTAALSENVAPAHAQDDVDHRVLAIVRDLAGELHPGMPLIAGLGLDASIERDYGLDSLARVELALRIEQVFATSLPEDALAQAEAPLDLARALRPREAATVAASAASALIAEEPRTARAPDTVTTLIEALEWHAAEQPNRTHVLLIDRETEPERISFSSLRKEAAAVAAGLLRRGIRPGETVAVMLPTGREFFAAFYGALYAQAVPVPLYPPARPAQIESHLRRIAGIVSNSQARILLTFDRAKHLAHLLRPLTTSLEIVATIEEVGEPGATCAPPPVSDTDTAFLQYTSGSTGQPKGVILTHANLLANLQAMQRATGVTAADCFVSWLPLYHDMGLIGACFGALVIGFPLVLMSPLAFLSRPVRWLRSIHGHGATITATPNFAYELCLNKIPEGELAGLDLSSLRLMINGAEAVSAQTVERFAERFARYGLRRTALMPVYGLAECALGLTFSPVGRGPLIERIDRDTFLRKGVAKSVGDAERTPLTVVSCGTPLPDHLLRIVDEGGALLPERAQGRIQFQGPSATSGYFRNPEETARLFDGAWTNTGDLGYMANGELYVTGREKDIIIRGGHNIHPQELEQAVAQLPGVRKGGVAVFPALDRHSGTERIVVLAETRAEDPGARAELVASINRLAVDLIGLPVDVVLASPRTVLKTSSGKIRRSACREAYERGELSASSRAPWRHVVRFARQGVLARSRDAARRLAITAWGLRAVLVSVGLAPLVWLGVVLTPHIAQRRRIAVVLARLALRLCGVPARVQTSGHSARGPCVFVANHASYLDGIMLTASLPPGFAFVAKRELAESMLIGILLKRLNCVFVERQDVQEAAAGADELQLRLRAGESLAVFPEGTFHRDAGLLSFHMGAFMAAVTTGAAVVPVALCGTRLIFPAGAWLPRPTAIDVIILEPLAPADRSWGAALKLRDETRAHILAHVREPDLEQVGRRTLRRSEQ
jgi:1-acyl-sn-glycerol-3-phosphate acyltransferase